MQDQNGFCDVLLVLRAEQGEDCVPGGVLLSAVVRVGDRRTLHIALGDLSNLVPASSICTVPKARVIWLEINKRPDIARCVCGHRAATFRWIQEELLAQGSRQGTSFVQRVEGTGIASWPTVFASTELPLPSSRR